MTRRREAWALALAAGIILGCLGLLWLNTDQPSAPTTVEETNADADAPQNADETPPSATGGISD